MSSRSAIHARDWVVVCDGRKALILENAGDERALDLRVRTQYEHSDLATHLLGTDRPGRLQPAVGTARSAVEQADFHDAAERDFLNNLAERLDAEVRAGSVKTMVVVAPPRALGVLREAFTPALAGAISREIRKDWVKRPVWQIERSLITEAAAP